MNIEEGEVPQEHKQILDARISAFESGQAETIEWDEAVKRLLNTRLAVKKLSASQAEDIRSGMLMTKEKTGKAFSRKSIFDEIGKG